MSIAIVVLFWVAATGVHDQDYAFDPLHFFERGSRFLCLHLAHNIVLIVAVVTATTNIVRELRRRRKSALLGKFWYVIGLIALLWLAAWLLMWFTIGVVCGGG